MPAAFFLDAAIAFFKRYRAMLIILPLVIALGVQSWRLSGVKDRLTTARATIAQLEQASKSARAAQIAANQAAEARHSAIAKDIDHAHQIALAEAHSAAERFIAANRVRPNDQGSPGRSTPPAVYHGAPVGTGSDTASELVAITAADVRACTAQTLQADAGREWAERLIAEGLATAD